MKTYLISIKFESCVDRPETRGSGVNSAEVEVMACDVQSAINEAGKLIETNREVVALNLKRVGFDGFSD